MGHFSHSRTHSGNYTKPRRVRPSKNFAGSVCLQGDKHTKNFEHVRAFDGTPKLGKWSILS